MYDAVEDILRAWPEAADVGMRIGPDLEQQIEAAAPWRGTAPTWRTVETLPAPDGK